MYELRISYIGPTVDVLDGASSGAQLDSDALDDDPRARQHFSAHSNHRPTHGLEQRDAVDVPGSLTSVRPMLDAVVLNRDFLFAPSHVDPDERVTEFVEKLDLSFRRRQPSSDQQQPHSTLLGRLRTPVDQFQCGP